MMGMRNITLNEFLMHITIAMVGNTKCIGKVTAKNMTSGFLVQNFKSVKDWMIGWHLRVDLLKIRQLLPSTLPAGSFFPLGFDAPMCLDFTYPSTNLTHFFIIPFFKGGEGVML